MNKPFTKIEPTGKNRKGGLYYRGFKKFIALFFNHYLYKRVYYPDVENILPDGSPQIIISNHQNCLIDAIAVMLAFRGPGRKPYFWARADIFAVSKVLEKYIRFLGLMPAFRASHEGMDDIGKNESSFHESRELLADGQSVMLFPEAGHQDKRYLGEFHGGFTTMAFQAAEDAIFEKDIYILPVINHYSDYFGMRREMLIKFGKPISLREYYDLYKEKPRTAMRQVSERFHNIISSMMLDIRDLDNYDSIDFLRTNYGVKYAAIKNLPYKILPEKLETEKKMVADLAALDDEKRTFFYNSAAQLKKGLDETGLKFKDLKRKVSTGQVIFKALACLVLLPLWIVSLWPHYLIYNIPKPLTNRMKDKMLSGSFFLGMSVVITIPLFYLISFFVVWGVLTIYMALIYLALLPFLGLFCWEYTELWDSFKQDLRLWKFQKRTKSAILRGFKHTSETIEDQLWSLFRI
ncbi:MAG: 1-acyl-sn-glycerol-3-phosphate acyltransferase [Bacteroidales bacterium]|nr:1-acyl-sn-glycerol-3-phosphate acyltransferase [Bacteroidales bacterium]